MSNPTPREVLDALKQHYNGAELEELALFVDIPYGNLEGASPAAKALAMVKYSQRHGKYDELVQEMANHPQVKWEGVKANKPQAQPQSQQAAPIIIIYGDVITGDKVDGDNFNIGDIIGNTGLAVGQGASANVSQIKIEKPPENKDEFNQQLQLLKVLIEQAATKGDINEENGNTAAEGLQDLLSETNKENPRNSRIVFYLNEVSDIVDAAGKAGTTVLGAAPIIAGLIEAAEKLF